MEAAVAPLVLYIAFGFLLLALSLALIHLVRRQEVNDRIVAMDLIAAVAMGFVLVYSLLVNKALYFDVAIIISLVSFIGTVAISTYLRQRR